MASPNKIGQVVQLKSGGPLMTVNEALDSSGEKYRCRWFTKEGIVQAGDFASDALVVVPKESKPKPEGDDE